MALSNKRITALVNQSVAAYSLAKYRADRASREPNVHLAQGERFDAVAEWGAAEAIRKLLMYTLEAPLTPDDSNVIAYVRQEAVNALGHFLGHIPVV